jgi:hypothetical protein
MSAPSQTKDVTTSAREKVQDILNSLRSMTSKDDAFVSKSRGAMDTSEHGIQKALDTMMKAMFSSCTTGASQPDPMVQPPTLNCRSCRTRSTETSDPISPSREKEEFFYSQFLAKDASRGEQAVQCVRENYDRTIASRDQASQKDEVKSIPKPFPVSSPSRPILLTAQAVNVQVQEIIPPVHKKFVVNEAVSFDDGISCISAYTLEEMARQTDMLRERAMRNVPSDLTSEGFETIESKASSVFDLSPQLSRQGVEAPGYELAHRNSRTTVGSKKSLATRSTRTNSFERAWQLNEQKYWQGLIDNDESEFVSADQRHKILWHKDNVLQEHGQIPSNESKSPLSRKSVSSPFCLFYMEYYHV